MVKLNVQAVVQGDVVLECVTADQWGEREDLMFRLVFSTAFVRSNMLLLAAHQLDVPWHCQHLFPPDFRVEVRGDGGWGGGGEGMMVHRAAQEGGRVGHWDLGAWW